MIHFQKFMCFLLFLKMAELLEANTTGATDVTDAVEQPRDNITISKTELQEMISAADRASRDDDPDSSEAESGDLASGAASTLLLLDEQKIETLEPVSESMAHTVRTRLKQNVRVEILDRKRKLYKSLPANMQWAKETAVNPEIYGGRPMYVKNNDRRYNIIVVLIE